MLGLLNGGREGKRGMGMDVEHLNIGVCCTGLPVHTTQRPGQRFVNLMAMLLRRIKRERGENPIIS